MKRLYLLLLLIAPAVVSCGDSSDSAQPELPRTPPPPASTDQPPVPLNSVSPIVYPAEIAAQQFEGRVLLRLHVDSTGTLLSDSVHIAESSGYPALDSAALAGARELRFSPGLHDGRPVAVSFLQPVLFRTPRARGAVP